MDDSIDGPLAAFERPIPSTAVAARFGSDVVAETLRALEIPYIALNPGSSIAACTTASSIISAMSGRKCWFACMRKAPSRWRMDGPRSRGRPMAAAVHSNVGLLHATMAVFNAWCDRAPVLLLGATGPVDAPRRRPWIDWIHTAAGPGRDRAQLCEMGRAARLTGGGAGGFAAGHVACGTAPMGPVYVNLDAGMQEAALAEPVPPPAPGRFLPPVPRRCLGRRDRPRQSRCCGAAHSPMILMGRVSRDPAHGRFAWRSPRH